MRDLNYELKRLGDRNRDGSFATQANRWRILKLCADQLHELGYHKLHAHELKWRHVQALVQRWQREALSVGTIKNRLEDSWTKGGRPRVIPITQASQREVLDRAHQLAGKGSLIPPQLTYVQQLKRLTQGSRRPMAYAIAMPRHATGSWRTQEPKSAWARPAGRHPPRTGRPPASLPPSRRQLTGRSGSSSPRSSATAGSKSRRHIWDAEVDFSVPRLTAARVVIADSEHRRPRRRCLLGRAQRLQERRSPPPLARASMLSSLARMARRCSRIKSSVFSVMGASSLLFER